MKENLDYKLASLIINILEEKKVDNIKVIKVIDVMPIADFFIIGTIESTPQASAVVSELNKILKDNGYSLINRKNFTVNDWILLDYNSVIIHLFNKDKRDFYNLEGLWSKYVITKEKVIEIVKETNK
ncbi:MAG: ribosome silencing factor [Spirochaetes bacterium]|nr:ribosome silencing factor [Spirochaetota bacterium]